MKPAFPLDFLLPLVYPMMMKLVNKDYKKLPTANVSKKLQLRVSDIDYFLYRVYYLEGTRTTNALWKVEVFSHGFSKGPL